MKNLHLRHQHFAKALKGNFQKEAPEAIARFKTWLHTFLPLVVTLIKLPQLSNAEKEEDSWPFKSMDLHSAIQPTRIKNTEGKTASVLNMYRLLSLLLFPKQYGR